jgi:hypothetical protein
MNTIDYRNVAYIPRRECFIQQQQQHPKPKFKNNSFKQNPTMKLQLSILAVALIATLSRGMFLAKGN